jgi:hypothetical protein
MNWATVAQDLSPDAVIPVPVSGATPGETVVSDPFVITGVSGPIPIGFDSQFAGCGPNEIEISIDGGVTWSAPTLNGSGTGGGANGAAGQGILLPAGQPVRLRVVAPAARQQGTAYLRYGVNSNTNSLVCLLRRIRTRCRPRGGTCPTPPRPRRSGRRSAWSTSSST